MKNRIIFAILLFVYCSLMFYGNSQKTTDRFLSLESHYFNHNLTASSQKELEKGEIVGGSFIFPHPHLGQLAVRFNNNNHDSEDVVLFRIKEADAKNWYYQAKYNTDQFLPGEQFPFGFPPIKESVYKKYYFEIESLKGAPGKGISIDFEEPIFSAKAIYSKNDFLSGNISPAYFIYNKIIDLDYSLLNILRAFYPLFIFLFLLIFYYNRFIYPTYIFVIVSFSIFAGNKINDISALIVFIAYFLTSIRYRLESRVTYLYLGAQLTIATVLLVLGYQENAAVAGVWIYIFLIIVLFQHILEDVFNVRPKVTMGEFITSARGKKN